MKTSIYLIVFYMVIHSYSIFAQANQKHRVIILSDIEADPDDSQSFVRLAFIFQ